MHDANLRAHPESPLPAAAIAALHKGRKVEAIKIVRQERNIGLKEAKGLVDEYLRSQPSLRSSLAAAGAEAKRGALLWLAALIALAVLVYHFLAEP
jgi:ribosomal protein L7/L12